MIELTKSSNGNQIYIAPEHLVSFELVDDVTMINLHGDRIFVKETPQQVLVMVSEYKQNRRVKVNE